MRYLVSAQKLIFIDILLEADSEEDAIQMTLNNEFDLEQPVWDEEDWIITEIKEAP